MFIRDAQHIIHPRMKRIYQYVISWKNSTRDSNSSVLLLSKPSITPFLGLSSGLDGVPIVRQFFFWDHQNLVLRKFT